MAYVIAFGLLALGAGLWRLIGGARQLRPAIPPQNVLQRRVAQ